MNERVEVERAHFLVQEPVRPIEVNLDDEGHEGEVPGRAAETQADLAPREAGFGTGLEEDHVR